MKLINLKPLLVKIAFKFIPNFVDDIGYEPVEKYLNENLDFIREFVLLYVDSEDDNKAQAKQFWVQNREQIAEGLRQLTADIVDSEVDDPEVKEIVNDALNLIFEELFE